MNFNPLNNSRELQGSTSTLLVQARCQTVTLFKGTETLFFFGDGISRWMSNNNEIFLDFCNDIYMIMHF